MEQQTYPAVFMRGGTSKGLFFRAEHLPADPVERDDVFCAAMGSPDSYGRQLNGMGGGVSSLSKVMVVARSQRPGIDVDYTFGQVAVGAPHVDWKSNCGNLSSAVGPFAVDEGLVRVEDSENAILRMFNTNTRKTVLCRFPVRGGRAAVAGDLAIDGVSGTGAAIRLDFLDPGGAVTRALLPTGNPVDALDVEGLGTVEVSIVDATNPVAFVRAAALGLAGTELPDRLRETPDLLARLEAIRTAAAVRAGLAEDVGEAGRNWQSSPKIALVSRPADAKLLSGRLLEASACDVQIRMISMGLPHGAVPLTGAMCVAAAARVEGTIVHEASRRVEGDTLRVGHASGALPVAAKITRNVDGGYVAESASVFRTARRLMSGSVYAPVRS